MRCSELFESELGDFQERLLLMKHGKLSNQQAAELFAKLKAFDFYVRRGRHVVALRWVEDGATGTLKMVTASMPGTWRSGPAAVSRYRLVRTLRDYGFQTARLTVGAQSRQQDDDNSQNIYFWGPGTPPPETPNQ